MFRAALASWFVIFLLKYIALVGLQIQRNLDVLAIVSESGVQRLDRRLVVAVISISWQQLPGRLVLCSFTSCTSDAPLALASAFSCPRTAALTGNGPNRTERFGEEFISKTQTLIIQVTYECRLLINMSDDMM
jgi:hypothetical protein